MIDANVKNALESPEPKDALVNLVLELSAAGFSRRAIYDLFLEYHNRHMYSEPWIEIENKFGGDHPVDTLLDRLSGFCGADHVLLPDEAFEKN